MSFRVEVDDQGAYIDVLDDDNDYVTLQKVKGEYYYRIRGPVAEALHAMEESLSLAKEQQDHAMFERDELLYSILHTKAMKRFLSKRKREEN